jgi:hypothetical protein
VLHVSESMFLLDFRDSVPCQAGIWRRSDGRAVCRSDTASPQESPLSSLISELCLQRRLFPWLFDSLGKRDNGCCFGDLALHPRSLQAQCWCFQRSPQPSRKRRIDQHSIFWLCPTRRRGSRSQNLRTKCAGSLVSGILSSFYHQSHPKVEWPEKSVYRASEEFRSELAKIAKSEPKSLLFQLRETKARRSRPGTGVQYYSICISHMRSQTAHTSAWT